MSDKKFKVGDKVRYIGKDHREMPEFYPPVGTIGTVINQSNECDDVYVQWEKGSTSRKDCWYCDRHDVELVENVDMTNEEIWEMLESKMRKNGLKKKMGALYCDNNLTNGYWVYTLDDVHNAIAIAYRSGYERAMKGRPFKIGEKKKKGGHWEPIDPENLPKEGTRVRYSRPICFEDEFYLIGWNVGDEGIVNYHGNYFGVKREGKNWDGVGMFGHCFDMWVEDDE